MRGGPRYCQDGTAVGLHTGFSAGFATISSIAPARASMTPGGTGTGPHTISPIDSASASIVPGGSARGTTPPSMAAESASTIDGSAAEPVAGIRYIT